MPKGLSRVALNYGRNEGTRFRQIQDNAEVYPSGKDSPRNVALREEAKAFALQNRCGAL